MKFLPGGTALGPLFSFSGFSISPPIRTGAETSVGLRIIGQISRKVDGARAYAAP